MKIGENEKAGQNSRYQYTFYIVQGLFAPDIFNSPKYNTLLI